MSSVTALMGAKFNGLITIEDSGLTGMITLRGNLKSPELAKVIKSLTGAAMPKPRQVTSSKKGAVAWMSPDELMLFLDYELVDTAVLKIERAMKGKHFLVANVSDARAVFDLSGREIRDVLAKTSPADLSSTALPIGEICRSRMGQLAVAYWFTSDTTAHLVCFRSVGEHIFAQLATAAQKGSSVSFH